MAQCYNKIYLKDRNIEVDCGKCLNCQENRKQEASSRMIAEMSSGSYVNKYFITLTYDPLFSEYDENTGLTKLKKEHLKKYIESLQWIHKRHYGEDYKLRKNKLKYIACGEYGQNGTKRAHYHLVVMTNIFIERYIRKNWKYGNVYWERLKDVRGIAYTSGYTNKKYNKKDKDREIQPFVKWSIGLGKDWIHKQIVAKKISASSYNVKTILGPKRLPTYFKRKFKESIMGVTPKYKKLNDLEKEIFYRNNGYKRKTVMINQNEYDRNLYKWERFIDKLKIEIKKFDILYLQKEELKKRYGDSWQRKLYNLLYNEKWDEMDEVEREFTQLKEKENELLKIKAINKLYRKKARNKIA